MKEIRSKAAIRRPSKTRVGRISGILALLQGLITRPKPANQRAQGRAATQPTPKTNNAYLRPKFTSILQIIGGQRRFTPSLPSWFSMPKISNFPKIRANFSRKGCPPPSFQMPMFLVSRPRSIPTQSAESVEKRLLFLEGLFFLAFLILAVRAFDLTVLQHDTLRKRAQNQYRKHVIIPAHRGQILDRNGRTLAISLPVKALSVDIDRMGNPELLAKRLAPIIGLSQHALYQRLSRSRPGTFPILKRRLPPVAIRRIQQMQNPALFLIPETQRFYPLGEITSHLLGFTNFAGQGVEGLERSFEKDIQGSPGSSIFTYDRLGQPLPMAQTITEANPGSDMVLTIDSNIQYIAYRTLLEGVTKSRAKGGMVVVMDPNTGEVYAMVNQPGFNPNNLSQSKASDRRNRSIADAYEPGSTFKIVTVSAALDLGLVTPDTLFDVEGGKFRVANRTIRDFHQGFHWLKVSQIVETSSNVGAAKIGLKLGNANMDHYIERFGFGRHTEIGISNESPGSIPDISAYHEVGLVSRSYGYGITATPLQLTMASAAAVNGGKLLVPRIVVGKKKHGQWIPREVPAPEQIIKPETSAMMRTILAMAVGPEGTAPKAQIDGYTVAGKTGTARKAMGKEGYVRGHYFSSFVGYVPAEKPELLIYVGIDEPQGVFYGGLVAAPIFHDIAQEILPLLSIFPEKRAEPGLPAFNAPTPEILPHLKVTQQAVNKTTQQPKKEPEKEKETQEEKLSHTLLQLNLVDALEQLKKENIIPRVEGHGRVVRVLKNKNGEFQLFLQ